jgi:pimeloyl-ACP methyl ester carboxylesterase
MKKIAPILALLLAYATNLHAAEGVILLHGLCRSDASMETMESALTKAGFLVLNVDYPSRTAAIETLSEAAIGGALNDKRLAECTKIHFVTHSLGGILVRSYFKRHEHARLGRVVMLGPPNQGSEVVDILGSWWFFKKLNGPAGQELGTDNESVPNTLGAVNFDLGIIAGDRSIDWVSSAMVDGPDDGKVSIERTKVTGMKEHSVVHATHSFIMNNNNVIELTISFLKTGSFKPENTRPDE